MLADNFYKQLGVEKNSLATLIKQTDDEKYVIEVNVLDELTAKPFCVVVNSDKPTVKHVYV